MSNSQKTPRADKGREEQTALSKKIALVLNAVFIITILVFLFLTATNFWGD